MAEGAPDSRPLVSVCTGTWRRRDLLMEAIENVREQTYRPLEHVIVSDGPDPILREMLADELGYPGVPIVFDELGRNTSTALRDSISAVPFGVAVWKARGDYVMWWADDERALVPDHIESLVDLIERTGVDFVYPRVNIYWKGRPDHVWPVGVYPPEEGTVTHVLHRWDILDVPGGYFLPHTGSTNDWAQIEAWLAAGKTCAMLDRVTFQHRADK